MGNRYGSNFQDNENVQCSFSSTDGGESACSQKRVEKTIDISIKDNEKLRCDLIDRCENIVLTIIEKLLIGVLPEISYRITNIDSLMEQIESIDPRVCEDHQETEENPATFYDDSLGTLQNPDSGICESFEPELPSEQLSEPRQVVSLGSWHSQRKFALIMTTMAKVHRLLVKNRTETRRAFFYELKSNEATSKLVSNQTQIDRIVNILANLLDCAPWDMALVASAKGLGSGDLILTLGNNERIDYSAPGGVLIPPIVSNVTSVRTKADFVLVVEKDSVFQKLIQENCPFLLNCIVITGKGYPDVATRILVKILAEKLKLPVYVLVDADPYGIEIMLTYKYGSINLSYEQGNLACPSVLWIGLHPSDFECLGIPTISLTDSDIAKLDNVHSRPYITDRVSVELQIMRRGKAEIEAIIAGSDESDLTTFYIWRKIQDADYI